MNAQDMSNLVSMFFDQAEDMGKKPFLSAKIDDKFKSLSWNEVSDQIIAMARGLKALGIKKGDRVVLVSENRPEWLIADLAIMAAGGITVPAYTTNTVEDHRHIVENSGAAGIIISTRQLAENALQAAHQCEATQFAICIETVDLQQSLSLEVINWDTAIKRGGSNTDDIIAQSKALKRTDVACIIYTSGTSGVPKGVMLSHGSILHNIAGAKDVLIALGLGNDIFLSFLPLSHSYEHTAGQFLPILIGAQIAYAEGADKLLANMAETNPTIIMAVPRLYEMMHSRILRGVEQGSAKKQALFHKTVELGTKAFNDPDSMTIMEKLQNFILGILVRKKIEKRFGGRLKAFISGGAPLNPEIGMFFTALGVRILQGYGQTESGPVVSVNMPGHVKMHAVGPAFDGVDVKIAIDGEVLIKGELVMNGYWNDEAATNATIVDGWLHTGDIGLIDDDGHIQITDRKKDIIVNSGGDNIAPQRIEGMLTLEPEISQAMVYGDKRPHLVGLIVPDSVWLEEWKEQNGKTGTLPELSIDPDLHSAISTAVSTMNGRLSNIEKVRKFIIASEVFSVENQQMTPTMKVRRHKLKADYGDQLEGLYS